MSSSPPIPPPLSQGWRRLRGYLSAHRLRYAVGTAVTTGYVAALTAVPPLVGWCIQGVDAGLGAGEIRRRCVWLAVATVVQGGLRLASRIALFDVARRIEYEIRRDFFAHLQRLPQSYYQRMRTGDLMSRVVNDLNSVRLMLGPGVLSAVQTPILFASCFGVMFWLDPSLALLVFLPYPAFVWLARAFGRFMHRANLGVQEGLGALSNEMQEIVSGIGVVKSYTMEAAIGAHFAAANDSLLRRQLRMVRANAALPAISILLPAASMGIAFWVGATRIAAGSIDRSVFFTFAMYIYQLTFPTFIMGWAFALVQRGRSAMGRIEEILATPPAIADAPGLAAPPPFRGGIEFRGLDFRYPGARQPALRGIDLRVAPGTVLGVVGPVGAGKSTLLSLLPHLHEVPEGCLFFDGIEVHRIPLAALRSQIAVVPQESFLFSVSVAENIAYGRPDVPAEEVFSAARRAQLARDLADFPDGYDTVVGERGVMLSGGQRQRTTLARALLREAPILLLDDALSAVDAQTENEIREALQEGGLRGRTAIVVSHRIASVRDADQIVVLDAGRIVERGSHAALLARGGLYARLAREQEIEEELRWAGAAS